MDFIQAIIFWVIVIIFFRLIFKLIDVVLDRLAAHKTFKISGLDIKIVTKLSKYLLVISEFIKYLSTILYKIFDYIFAPKYTKISFTIIIILALGIRLFLAFNFEGTGDTGGWRLGGKTGLENQNYGMGNGTIYDGDCLALCANWPPLTYHYMIAMRWSYLNLNFMNLPDVGFYKLLPVFTGTGIVLLLYFLAKTLGIKKPLVIASLYAFHPIPLYVSAYHGQRDVVWLFFSLLSIIFLNKALEFKKHRPKQENFSSFWDYLIFYLDSVFRSDKALIIVSGIFFGLGVSFKIPLLLFLPFFFLRIPTFFNKILFILANIMTVFLLNIPEVYIYPYQIIQQVVLYKGWFGWWGLSGIFAKMGDIFGYPALASDFYPFNKLILFSSIALTTILLWRKRVNLLSGVLLLIMMFFVFTPSFASQYLIWPLPFIVLFSSTQKNFFRYYSIFSTLLIINFYTVFGFTPLEKFMLYIQQVFAETPLLQYPMDTSLPLWLFSIYYCYKMIKLELHSTNEKHA